MSDAKLKPVIIALNVTDTEPIHPFF